MYSSYRVTKYKNVDENGDIYSLPDEWTSFFDVGEKVSLEEYESIEKQYIDFIYSVCQFFKVDGLEIKDLEINEDDIDINDKEIMRLEGLSKIIKDVLRESIWCKLTCDKFEFHFGYDFYMYLVSGDNLDVCIENIDSQLTIQKYESPYID